MTQLDIRSNRSAALPDNTKLLLANTALTCSAIWKIPSVSLPTQTAQNSPCSSLLWNRTRPPRLSFANIRPSFGVSTANAFLLRRARRSFAGSFFRTQLNKQIHQRAFPFVFMTGAYRSDMRLFHVGGKFHQFSVLQLLLHGKLRKK